MKRTTLAAIIAVCVTVMTLGVTFAVSGADGSNDDSTTSTTISADDTGGDNSASTGGDTGINTSASCVTTGEAKSQLGLDVQRLGLEACGWVFRSVGVGSTQATCPNGWVCTLHLADDSINVYVGDGESYTIVAGTFRMIDAYPSNDAVHEDPPCDLLRKEKNFGQVEDPSFPVNGGNFTCGGDDNSRSSGSSSSALACPAGTSPLPDDPSVCKYGPTGQNDPVNVPAGWTAEYWDGSTTRYATGPKTIQTGEATLRPAA